MDNAKVTPCAVASAQSAYVLLTFRRVKEAMEVAPGDPWGLTPQVWMQPTASLQEMPALELLGRRSPWRKPRFKKSA